MNWIQALKHWNDKKGGKYTIPKKGSKEHAEVMKIMNATEKTTKTAKAKTAKAKTTKAKTKGGALNRDYAIEVGTQLLKEKGVQSPTEEQAIAEAERDMDEKFKKATEKGLEKAKEKPKRKYVKRIGQKIVGGALKAKSPIVIDGIEQYTEKADRMKGGNLMREKLLGGAMKKQLHVIAGLPQVASVKGGSMAGGRTGASDPKLYGLRMFGQ